MHNMSMEFYHRKAGQSESTSLTSAKWFMNRRGQWSSPKTVMSPTERKYGKEYQNQLLEKRN